MDVTAVFTCVCDLWAIDSLGIGKPIVQRENPETSPKSLGSLFISDRSPAIQVNKVLEPRIDLKIVEPSYTSAVCQLKSRIAFERCFSSIEYGRREHVFHRDSQNVLVHTPGYGWYRQQVFD
jgi:hypothetical protein